VRKPVSCLDFLELEDISETLDCNLGEFQFLSKYLLVGVGYNPLIGASSRVRTKLLGTLYCDNSPAYDTVVLDISDFEKIRYRIAGFIVNQMAEVNVCEDGDYDL
jgi:hypothetical protein